MGDHRAEIKIEAEFHGIKDKTDMSINWIEEIPSSVEEFFRNLYARGIARYDEQMRKYWAEENKGRIEKEERLELERLKKKYPAPEKG